MANFTSDMIAKAKIAKSAEELCAMAKANNVELTAEEAKIYFEQLNASGAVSDDALDGVAGGEGLSCPSDDAPQSGDRVRFKDGRACEQCGCTTGILERGVYVNYGDNVKCAQCGASIGRVTATGGKIEKI